MLGLNASLVYRLIGLLLVFAGQIIVHNVILLDGPRWNGRLCCAVKKGNQRQSD